MTYLQPLSYQDCGDRAIAVLELTYPAELDQDAIEREWLGRYPKPGYQTEVTFGAIDKYGRRPVTVKHWRND